MAVNEEVGLYKKADTKKVKNMKPNVMVAGTTCVAAMVLSAPVVVQAQPPKTPEDTRITLDLRDADIRTALKQIFDQAGVDYSLDPAVQGYVTLKLTDQSFDIALRSILRSSQTPLTFTKVDKIYTVKPRPVTDPNAIANAAPPPVDPNANTQSYAKFEQIPLQYIDPADLSNILGVTILPTFIRGNSGGGNRGGGGGFGGGGFGGGGFGGGGGLGGGGFGGGGFGGGGLGGGGFGGGGFGGGGFGGGGFGGGGFGGGGFGGGGFGGGGFGGGGFGGGRGF